MDEVSQERWVNAPIHPTNSFQAPTKLLEHPATACPVMYQDPIGGGDPYVPAPLLPPMT